MKDTKWDKNKKEEKAREKEHYVRIRFQINWPYIEEATTTTVKK